MRPAIIKKKMIVLQKMFRRYIEFVINPVGRFWVWNVIKIVYVFLICMTLQPYFLKSLDSFENGLFYSIIYVIAFEIGDFSVRFSNLTHLSSFKLYKYMGLLLVKHVIYVVVVLFALVIWNNIIFVEDVWFSTKNVLILSFCSHISLYLIYRAIYSETKDELDIPQGNSNELKTGRIIHITGLNNEEDFYLAPQDFLFAKSEGHYVKIFFFSHENDKIYLKRKIIRNSMKNIESMVSKSNDILRVHKSYTANVKIASRISGGSHGGTIYYNLKKLYQIPYSRSFYPNVKGYLNNKEEYILMESESIGKSAGLSVEPPLVMSE